MKHNGIIYLCRHEGLLREVAHGVKDGVGKYADMAAILFDRLLPLDCIVVPMPSHRGRADTMLDVALRLAKFSHRKVCDALSCDPHESSYEQKQRGLKPTPIFMRTNAVLHGCVCVIDNCVSSGVTAFATLGRNTNGARVCADNRKLLEESEMKKRYIVETHVGVFDTWATSAKKAISNIRFRLFGGQCGVSTIYWKAWEA